MVQVLPTASSRVRVVGGGVPFGNAVCSICEGGRLGESACGSSSEVEGRANRCVLQGREGDRFPRPVEEGVVVIRLDHR